MNKTRRQSNCPYVNKKKLTVFLRVHLVHRPRHALVLVLHARGSRSLVHRADQRVGAPVEASGVDGLVRRADGRAAYRAQSSVRLHPFDNRRRCKQNTTSVYLPIQTIAKNCQKIAKNKNKLT